MAKPSELEVARQELTHRCEQMAEALTAAPSFHHPDARAVEALRAQAAVLAAGSRFAMLWIERLAELEALRLAESQERSRREERRLVVTNRWVIGLTILIALATVAQVVVAIVRR